MCFHLVNVHNKTVNSVSYHTLNCQTPELPLFKMIRLKMRKKNEICCSPENKRILKNWEELENFVKLFHPSPHIYKRKNPSLNSWNIWWNIWWKQQKLEWKRIKTHRQTNTRYERVQTLSFRKLEEITDFVKAL